MSKKFYDIFPPGTKEVSEKPSYPQESFKKKPSNKMNFKLPLIVTFLIVMIIFGIIVYSSHLVIHIIPENINIIYEGEIKGEKNSLYSDSEKDVIPLLFIEKDYQEKKSFPATGKNTEESYAEGIIRVYNNYSTSPQIFVINTRFVSAEGKLFRSIEQVSIPGGKQEEGGFVPGFLDIKVRAAEAGEDYNIEKQSKFSIPGLQGTPQYTSFFGENLKPIRGGGIGEMAKITQNDIENAKKILTDIIKEKIIEEFVATQSSDYVLDEKLILNTIIHEEVLSEPSKDSKNFEYEIKIASKILAFKEKDLDGVIQEKMKILAQETKPEYINIFDESYNLEYDIINMNFDDRNILLEVNSSAVFYLNPKEEAIKKAISSRKMSEVEEIMNNYEEILDFEMIFSPFWMKKIPKISKIEIQYRMP